MYKYKTQSLRSEIFISEVTKVQSFCSEIYDNMLLMGDFNVTPENRHLKDFSDSNDFENLIKEPICFRARLHGNLHGGFTAATFRTIDPITNVKMISSN